MPADRERTDDKKDPIPTRPAQGHNAGQIPFGAWEFPTNIEGPKYKMTENKTNKDKSRNYK